MVPPSRLRRVCLGLCLGLGLLDASAALAQAAGGLLPDFRGAERELARARHELEEIAGPDLQRREVSPLPAPQVQAALSLSDEELARVDRLGEVDPEEWSDQDRAWVRDLLPVDLALRAALAGEGEGDDGEPGEEEAVSPEELAARTLAPLRAVKVITLGDRLALLDGDFSAVLDGVELRERVAESHLLQRGLVGSGLGSAIHLESLRDLRAVLARREVPREALDRIDVHLLGWHQVVPSAAEVVAIEGLSILDRAEDLPGQLGGAGDAAAALFVAPVARDLADTARICQETGCADAAAFLERREEESDDPLRVIAQMMTPSILGLATKLDAVARLTEVAHVAVALRLEAVEMGGYPATPEELPSVLAARLDEIEGLEVEWLDGRVRLKLSSKELLSQWPEARRERLEPLFLWELPGPPAEPEKRGHDGAAAGTGPAAAKMPSSQGTS